MKYLLYFLAGLFTLASCQIEDDAAPSPNESFAKYYGELISYDAKDLEIIYDDSGVEEGFIVFGTRSTNEGDKDYFVFKTDLFGNILDSISFGLANTIDIDGDSIPDDITGDGEVDLVRGDEEAGQIALLANGGYVVVGTSTVTETNLGLSDWKLMTITFIRDSLITSTGEQRMVVSDDPIIALNATRDNTDLDLIGNDVIQLANGSLLFVGSREVSAGNFDNYTLKVGAGAVERSFGVPGTGKNESIVRVFEKANRNIVLIGHGSTASSLGENITRGNGVNAFFIEMNSELTSPINSAYYGIDNADPTNDEIYNDFVSSAISSPSGFTIVGTSTTSGNAEYGFMMNLSKNGVYLNGNSLPSADFGGIQTRVNGVTKAKDSDLLLVGQYPSFNATVNGQSLSKGDEGMFMRVDQGSEPVFESNFGLSDGSDYIVDAVTLSDGKIIALANVDFGGGIRLISLIKLNATGNFVN